MDFVGQLSARAAENPNEIAIDFPEGSCSYLQLERLVWRCVEMAIRNGVRRGDRVGLSFNDERLVLIFALAVTRLAAAITLIPPANPKEQKQEVIREASLAFFYTDHPDPMKMDIPLLIITYQDIETFGVGKEINLPRPDGSDLFVIHHGSGSTGKPKLLPCTHRQMSSLCYWQQRRYGSQPGDIWASLVFLGFRTPLIHALSAVTGGNRYVRSLTYLELEDMLTYCNELPVSYLSATPSQVHRILNATPKDMKLRLPNLKGLVVSFAAVTPALRAEIAERLTPNLFISYGTNEVGVMTILPPNVESSHDCSVGFPIDKNEIQIVDGKDTVVPAETPGLIRVRNDQHFEGYLGSQKDSDRVVRDGWFYPGDTGMLMPDGQLVHLGRADHMMIYRGVNIFPAEIEQVVSQLPGVDDVAAVPIHHPEWQDLPVCTFTLKPGYEDTPNKIAEAAGAKLGLRCPHWFLPLRSIPRNEQGKLDRATLNEIIRQALKTAPGAAD